MSGCKTVLVGKNGEKLEIYEKVGCPENMAHNELKILKFKKRTGSKLKDMDKNIEALEEVIKDGLEKRYFGQKKSKPHFPPYRTLEHIKRDLVSKKGKAQFIFGKKTGPRGYTWAK